MYKEIDLTLCEGSKHPDIKEDTWYLAQIAGQFYFGEFSPVWFGWNFDGWGGGSGLQLDGVGKNGAMWEGLWEITDLPEKKPEIHAEHHAKAVAEAKKRAIEAGEDWDEEDD